jgi:flagellar basal body-associated protein FliL
MMYAKGAAEKAAKQAELEQTPEYKLQQQLKFKKENKPPQFIKMDEFTVNLPGRGGEHYLQASMVLRTADSATEGRIKDFLPIVRDRVILVLSSRTMQELSTVEGKNAMAREIALVINSIIEPQLTAIFILQQQPGTADLQNLERIGAMPQSTTAGEKLSQTAVQAAAQFWKVSEMDLPVQQVLFDKFVMQ